MDDLRVRCNEYLLWFKNGNRDAAFFGLIEASGGVSPFLIERFRDERDDATRALIVKVVWQHRNPETIPFLAGALYDPSPLVWKEALDGLVTLGTNDSMDALRAARSRNFPDAVRQVEFQEWVNEALEQMNHGK